MIALAAVSAALVIALLLHLWRATAADAAALRSALDAAQQELRILQAAPPPSPPPPPPPPQPRKGCQTVCDRDCSRFDDCRGEAWVCINLFELLESDSGPTPMFSQCYGGLPPHARRGMKQLVSEGMSEEGMVVRKNRVQGYCNRSRGGCPASSSGKARDGLTRIW